MSESKLFMLKALAILAVLGLPGNFVTLYFLNAESNSVSNDTINISEPAIQGEDNVLPTSKIH